MNDKLNDNLDSIYKEGGPSDKADEHVKKQLPKEMEQYKWKPGESPNPGGRPKGKSITASLRRLIEEGSNADDMALVLYNLAQAGGRSQVEALKELLNRTDGKVLDTHRIEGDVPVTIVYKLKESKED